MLDLIYIAFAVCIVHCIALHFQMLEPLNSFGLVGGWNEWFLISYQVLWELKATLPIHVENVWMHVMRRNSIKFYLTISRKTNIFISQVFQAKQANVSFYFAFFFPNHLKTVWMFSKIVAKRKKPIEIEIVVSRCWWIQWAAQFSFDYLINLAENWFSSQFFSLSIWFNMKKCNFRMVLIDFWLLNCTIPWMDGGHTLHSKWIFNMKFRLFFFFLLQLKWSFNIEKC